MPERNNKLAKNPPRPRWLRDADGCYRPEGYEDTGIAIHGGPPKKRPRLGKMVFEVRLNERIIAISDTLSAAKTAAMRALTGKRVHLGRGRPRGTQIRTETPDQRLIHDLGGPREVAEMLGIPTGTVWSWISRGSVSGHQIPKLIEAARARGIETRGKEEAAPEHNGAASGTAA